MRKFYHYESIYSTHDHFFPVDQTDGIHHSNENEEEEEECQTVEGIEKTGEESPPVPSSSNYNPRAAKRKSSKWDDLVEEEIGMAAIKKENLLLEQKKLKLEIELLEKKLQAPANSHTVSGTGDPAASTLFQL